jgi:hypothetical protein
MFVKTKAFPGRRKKMLRIAALLIICIAVLFLVVNKMLNFPANVTTVDTSGRYLLENVPVGGIPGFAGMAYLRVIDKKHPEEVYRTPLYSTQLLDMRLTEDQSSVGVYWMYFNKDKKTFDIAMPQWEWHWMNIFISNTPYVHLEN